MQVGQHCYALHVMRREPSQPRVHFYDLGQMLERRLQPRQRFPFRYLPRFFLALDHALDPSRRVQEGALLAHLRGRTGHCPRRLTEPLDEFRWGYRVEYPLGVTLQGLE